MASAYAGQTALTGAVIAQTPAAAATAPGVITATTTLESYVPPKCLWSPKRRADKGAGHSCGIVVYKVSSNGKVQPRRLVLSADNRTILLSSSKLQSRIKSVAKLFKNSSSGDGSSLGVSSEMSGSGVRKIDISCLDSVQMGQLTAKFNLAKSLSSPMPDNNDQSTSSGTMEDSFAEAHSLSLIYKPISGPNLFGLSNPSSSSDGASTLLESLDLTVPSDDEHRALIMALDHLMVLYKRHRCHTHRDLLVLEHHWIDQGKSVDKLVYIGDWVSICIERLGISLSKEQLQGLFEQRCDALGVDHEEGLGLESLAGMLETIRFKSMAADGIVDPRIDIWDSVQTCDRIGKENFCLENAGINPHGASSDDDFVAAEGFLRFLHNEQRESNARLDDITCDLLPGLKGQMSFYGKPSHTTSNTGTDITKPMFFNYLNSDSNDILDPKSAITNKNDMSKPLNEYWINTSHKAYKVPSGKGEESAGVHPYILALQRGCRCLEIDVWDGKGKYSDSVVIRGTEFLPEAALPFQDLLRALRSFLWSIPNSYPIILAIENNCSISYQEIMSRQFDCILGREGHLYKPPGSLIEWAALPSPEDLRGKVVIKAKRPSPDAQSPTVVNDDFDDNIDIDLDEAAASSYKEYSSSIDGCEEAITGFDRNGVVVSTEKSSVNRTPQELFDVANAEAAKTKQVADTAERKLADLELQVDKSDKHADSLAGKVGISRSLFEDERLAHPSGSPTTNGPGSTMVGVSGISPSSENVSFDTSTVNTDWFDSLPLGKDISRFGDRLSEHMGLTAESSVDDDTRAQDSTYAKALSPVSISSIDQESIMSGEVGGIEVQDYIHESVNQMESDFAEADERAAKAAYATKLVLGRYNEKMKAYEEAENKLSALIRGNRDTSSAANRAATDARVSQEHAETAKQRVETVQQLLNNCRRQANSAETVARTGRAEAEISSQRAADAEKRAARAQKAAKKDKEMAELETKKEEELGKLVMEYRTKYDEASKNYKNAKDRLESATLRLSEVEKVVKSIESTPEFQIEYGKASHEHPEDEEIVVSPGSVLANHKTKMSEMKDYLQKVKASACEKASEEKVRKQSRRMLEEIQEKVKAQTKVAASARRQADHSITLADQLAEYADEERDAADMRKIALEKASAGVAKSNSHVTSVESQLREAERAAAAAIKAAEKCRVTADKFARTTLESSDTRELEARVNALKVEKERVLLELDAAKANQKRAEDDVFERKKRLNSNQELLAKAKKDSAEAVNREEKDKQLKVNAFLAHCQAVEMAKVADRAKKDFAAAVEIATSKALAARHAKDYLDRKTCVAPITPSLQQTTLIHNEKFFSFGKSLALPPWFSHSISERAMLDMTSRGGTEISQWRVFNERYISRVFPSKNKPSPAYLNPMVPWSLGCQMVSMNIQERNDSILLNDGRFRENGSCGYVLKPENARVEPKSHNLDDSCPDDEIHTSDFSRELKVQVLSGSNLPVPPGAVRSTNVCVFVSLFDGDSGLKSSPLTQTHVTDVVRGNMFCPVWNERKGAKFEARSESAMILFQVWASGDNNSQDSLIAATAVPLSCLRQGYRSVQLFDLDHTRRGAYGYASLLVHVNCRYLLSRPEL